MRFLPASTENGFAKVHEAIVWIDVESSGAVPETDELLEVAASITDLQGNRINNDDYQALVYVPHLSKILPTIDPHILKMHEQSGLWLDLWHKETKDISVIEQELIQWLDNYTYCDSTLYFGGNSITLDRNFLRTNVKKFYDRISHRSVDVTSLSIALQSNQNVNFFLKEKAHRALPDVIDSIAEYRYYMSHITGVG